MFDFLTGNSLWYLVKQSDFISKMVMLVLFGMSVLCWTIFICKLIIIHMRSKDIKKVHGMIGAVNSLDDLIKLGAHYSDTVPGRFITQTLTVLNTLVELQPNKASRNWQIMQYHLDQTVDALAENEEAYLPVLSTSAAVATLLGLFGTVWGLIHAFLRISEKQAADITVVAPGIAEALLTTLAGLLVAIPALVMYNILLTRVRRVENQIVQLGDRIGFIMQHTFLG